MILLLINAVIFSTDWALSRLFVFITFVLDIFVVIFVITVVVSYANAEWKYVEYETELMEKNGSQFLIYEKNDQTLFRNLTKETGKVWDESQKFIVKEESQGPYGLFNLLIPFKTESTVVPVDENYHLE